MNHPTSSEQEPAKYDHKAIEQFWQKEWEKSGIYKVEDKVIGKENYYQLVEFTYPSGDLHVGHWYAFAVPDIFARYKRMQGYNVLYPMGFDAFGLPAENAAIKLGADPKVWTKTQMEKMRKQFLTMGAIFDWDREVISCAPEYYKWTQWMFNQFYKNDLIYRDNTKVNWCPKDQTILANEQVIDGKCDRCGTEVEQRDQDQWMIRITRYADRLIDDLDALDWPHAIKEAQKNWIGRSVGCEINFKLKIEKSNDEYSVDVFTTRSDTLFGVTYLVIAPEHKILEELLNQISNKLDVEEYILNTKKKSELDRKQSKEKTGIELKGVKAINSENNEGVPVWVADYVLANYGTGAVMAVPAHDERDFEFAKKYNLPIKTVISPDGVNETPNLPYIEEGFLFDSDKYSQLPSIKARLEINKLNKETKTYRLRDWGISRQRYWGTPIPIVYDPDGNAHAIPDEHLPWILPTDVDHTPDGTAPLARSKELLDRTEKIFGKGWRPEVETMDTFVDSSWYFYRYLDNKNEKAFVDNEKLHSWMPIDLYMGGPEHTTMHLLYSRFWTKALNDLGFVKENEAYKIRRNRGLVLGPDGNKMSKSKGNVINPDEIVDRLGADTVRLYLAFMGPYGITANYPWDPNGVVGVRRFLERVWKLSVKIDKDKKTCRTDNMVHKTIKGVAEDIEEFKFNTAIAKMMILLNELEKEEKIILSSYKTLINILAPFAPHITEELWHQLGEKDSIHLSQWPKYDESLLVDEEVTIGVQINSKVRAELTISASATKDEIQSQALAIPRIIELTSGQEIKKVVVVPGRVINIII